MKHLLPILLLSASTAFSAALTHVWKADVNYTHAETVSARHGETIALAATLVDGGRIVTLGEGATAALCWQTNGMDTAWWSADACVTGGTLYASWTPSMDVGADRYGAFLRATTADGAHVYRAYVNFRLSAGTDYDPVILDWPHRTVDFANYDFTNANLVAYAYEVSQTNILTYSDSNLTVSNVAGADTNLVFSAASLVDGTASNVAARVANSVAETAIAEAKAVTSNWGAYDALGNANANGNAVVMNRPQMVIASGFAWETSGEYGALATACESAFASENGGAIRITASTGDYFGMDLGGGSSLVGVQTQGIFYDQEADTVALSYSGADVTHAETAGVELAAEEVSSIHIYWSTSVSKALAEWTEWTDGVQWIATETGAQAVLSVAGLDGAYFFARKSVPEPRFITTAPIRADGGYAVGDTVLALTNVVEIVVGGKTYRIMAQEVDTPTAASEE